MKPLLLIVMVFCFGCNVNGQTKESKAVVKDSFYVPRIAASNDTSMITFMPLDSIIIFGDLQYSINDSGNNHIIFNAIDGSFEIEGDTMAVIKMMLEHINRINKDLNTYRMLFEYLNENYWMIKQPIKRTEIETINN